MSRGARIVAAALVLAGAAGCAGGDAPRAPGGGATGMRFLSQAGEAGFRRAEQPIDLVFPQDHGEHPGFQTEWWYLTGNLADARGRHFGFQLTFFRYALGPPPAERDSQWRTHQVWMAHLAVTDTQGGRLVAEEKLSRGALGLAGASPERFDVWVESWRAARDAASGPIRLQAAGERASIDLELTAVKPVVLQGEAGLDRKGPESGNASYYYSIPRLAAAGTLGLDRRERFAVEGLAWLDREWGTSTLSAGVEGWDWFALQFDDGSDLMLYRLRNGDGSSSRFSAGTLVAAGGSSRALGAQDFALEAVRHWRSPASEIRYPVEWRLLIPSEALALRVRPRIDDQEIPLSVRYWEGAVEVTGRRGEQPVSGSGYLELAGYR